MICLHQIYDDHHNPRCLASLVGHLYTTFDTSDQRKSQGYISHISLTTGQYLDIALWLGQYHDIALTTTAFDAEAATKHQFPLIIYRDA